MKGSVLQLEPTRQMYIGEYFVYGGTEYKCTEYNPECVGIEIGIKSMGTGTLLSISEGAFIAYCNGDMP